MPPTCWTLCTMSRSWARHCADLSLSPSMASRMVAGPRAGLPYIARSIRVIWAFSEAAHPGSRVTRLRNPIRSPYRPRF